VNTQQQSYEHTTGLRAALHHNLCSQYHLPIRQV
jgi:hypothetical protein